MLAFTSVHVKQDCGGGDVSRRLACAGSNATFTFTLNNVGNIHLPNVTLSAPGLPAFTCVSSTGQSTRDLSLLLKVGASYMCR